MRTPLLLVGGLLSAGVGVVIGLTVASAPVEPDGDGGDDAEAVVVRGADGEERRLTVSEAAAVIERLEYVSERRRERHTDDDAEAAFDEDRSAGDDVLRAVLRKPDGSRYSFTELVGLIEDGDDPGLARAAIRELRRHDSDAARQTLIELASDGDLSAELRLAAARTMARPPHRDQLTEELIGMLAEEPDPAIRLELAHGVVRLQERGAWMQEISALLGEEADPEVRAELLLGVSRSSRDPAAQAELLALLDRPGVSVEERRRALAVLDRGRPSEELLERAEALFAESDPGLRQKAVEILTRSRDMDLDTFRDALTDADPGVRAAALLRGVRNLARMRRDKEVDQDARQAAVRQVAELAVRDPDPAVRRVAVRNVWNLPRDLRGNLLESARADSDPHVRLAAYGASPEPIRRQATHEFLGGLRSDDPGLRSAAYRQLSRLYALDDVPYNGRWNPDARARALREIELRVTGASE